MYSALMIEAALYFGITPFVHALTKTTASKPEERKVSSVTENKQSFVRSLFWFLFLFFLHRDCYSSRFCTF